MEAYVDKFHNLGGSTISEHQQNFNNFRKAITENLSETEVSQLLLLLKPLNIQEEIFLVRLLNHYNQYKQLLKILTSGHIIFKLILKNKGFVKFIAQNYSANAFADELCPQLSFVCRITLINKLGVVLESGDEYFKAIRARYGFRIVVNLLPTCSESLITSVIKENYVRLNDKQLIRIYKKFPSVLELYLKTTDTKLNGRKTLVKYFVQNDIKTLAALKEKFGNPSLGRIAVIKLLKYNKEEVINHSTDYYSHQKLIYRYLNEEDFKRFFKNMFPKNMNIFYFDYHLLSCIGLVPKDKKYDFFVGTYEELYGVKYENDGDSFIQNLPLKDRLKFNLENREHLLGADEGIEKLKAKIELTFNTNTKNDLFDKIIQCCKINDDSNAFLKVLEYFCKRHKNENSEVRIHFLDNVYHNSFDLSKLSDEHWKYINELLLICEINEDINNSKYYFLESKMLRNFKNNLDLKPLLKEYLQDKADYSYYIFLRGHPETQRECILQMNDLVFDIPRIKKENAAASYFNTIQDFNLAYPKMRISYFDFSDILKIYIENYETFNKTDYFFKRNTRAIVYEIPTDASKRKLWKEFVNCYLSKLDEDADEEIVYYIFKKQPEFIKRHATNILKHLRKFNKLYYELFKMHYSEMRKVFEEKCIEILEDPERLEDVPGTIQFLSYRKDFLKLVEKYKPLPDCKLNLYEDNVKITLNIQKAILKGLKNLRIVNDVWEEVLYYAKGDYLQYALEPLYNMLYRLKENQLHKPLGQLLKASASVRKHGIYLTSTLGSLEDIRLILSKSGETEKNPSVQKFIFKCTLSALCNTADETLWNLLVKHLTLINENDTESFDMLLNPKKIPRTYFAKYISEIWIYLKSKNKSHELKMINYLSFRIIEQLPNTFCNEVLTHTIAKSNIENSLNFIYNYLVRSKDFLPSRLELFINSLNKYIEEPTAKKHKIIHDLLENICAKLIVAKEKFTEETIKFSQHLLTNLSKFPINTFEIEMFLETIIRYDPKNIDNLTSLLLERQEKLINEFGPEIIMYHAEIEEKLLSHIYPTMEGDDTEQNLLVVESLLKQARNYYAKILVILLLPTSTECAENLKRKELIINELKKEEKEVVQLFLNKYLRL